MKAVVYQAPFSIAAENVPDPELQHPNDGIVKITSSCICGTRRNWLGRFSRLGLQPCPGPVGTWKLAAEPAALMVRQRGMVSTLTPPPLTVLRLPSDPERLGASPVCRPGLLRRLPGQRVRR